MKRSDKIRQLLRKAEMLMEQQDFVSERIDDHYEAPVVAVEELPVEIPVEALSEVVDENPDGGSDSNGPEETYMDSESPEGG